MSPENTHKSMGFYMEVLILDVIHTWTSVHGFCFFKLLPIGCIGLTHTMCLSHVVMWSIFSWIQCFSSSLYARQSLGNYLMPINWFVLNCRVCLVHFSPRISQCVGFNTIHPTASVWAQRIHISLWDFYGEFNTRRYTLHVVHGFYFFKSLSCFL